MATNEIDSDTYQFPDWYAANENNFESKLGDPCNMAHFSPTDLARFGVPTRAYISGTDRYIWLVAIPQGCQVYHASRALVVNNSGFPIISYNPASSKETNRKVERLAANKRMGIGVNAQPGCWTQPDTWSTFDGCVVNTYFASTPHDGYLHKDNGYLGSQIRYSYGFDNEGTGSSTFDRSASVANESKSGFLTYQTKKPLTYFLAMPDVFFVPRGFVSLHNMTTIFTHDELRDMDDRIKSTIGSSLKSNMRSWAKNTSLEERDHVVDIFDGKLGPILRQLHDAINSGEVNMGCIGTIRYLYEAYYSGGYSVRRFLEIVYDSQDGSVPWYQNITLDF